MNIYTLNVGQGQLVVVTGDTEAIIIDSSALDREYQKLRMAQWQHELVLEALLQGESARVEALMREHACIGLRYGRILGLASPVFS